METTLHVSDYSIHHEVNTDLKFIDSYRYIDIFVKYICVDIR